VLTLLVIPDVRQGRRGGIELVGVILASLGLFLVTFGLIEGQKFNWSTLTTQAGIDITIPEIMILGALVLIAFFVWDHFRITPLVPVSLFRDRNFAVMNWVSAALTFGMIGLFLPLTIYFQSALGFSPIKAGLTLAPMSVVSTLMAAFAGRYADKHGGKYIVMAGLGLFAVGMGIIDFLAGPNSDWYNFLPGALVAGLGLGMTFAPLATVALRNVRPRMAGAASGVLNTVRQLGGAVGSAVVGAVLQNRLATAFHDQAVQRSGQLPPAARQHFIDGFSKAASGGLDVGRSQGAAPVQGVPPQVAQQIAHVAHDVFTYGFIDAVRPTLLVPIVMLAIAAISCLAIKRRAKPAGAPVGRERAPAEPVAAG